LVKNVEKNCQRRPPNNHWPERADCPGGLWLLQLISYWFIDIYCGGGGGSRTRCPPWNHWGYWWGRSTFAVPDL